ncbi:hypothetical protein VPNG_06518 [Cytospora leucostoma]|uniref:Cytochrome b561 domain-containing protein n=1 Tax=Cytospora leucostoma TaxID=1230097 RepID=A0A423X2L2_9PEZI|nr:hypothetical protein VPNG_06518 [Cytospora leucostoma]
MANETVAAMNTVVDSSQLVLLCLPLATFILWHLWGHIVSPLKNYPGPLLARYTNLWRLYHTYRGSIHLVYQKLHEQYGHIVRVGPNVVDVDLPELTEFYHGSSALVNGKIVYNLFSETDAHKHAKEKRPIAKYYSPVGVAALEPHMDKIIGNLCHALETRFMENGHSFDLGKWLLYYTWDVVGAVTFSQPIGYLEKGHDFDGTLGDSETALDYFAVVGMIPVLDHWFDKNPVVHIGPPGFNTITGISLRHLVDRYQGKDADYHDPEQPDFLDKFIEAKHANPKEVDDAQIISWLMINMIAGADTTAATLRSAFYYSFRDKRIWKRLQDETLTAGLHNKIPVAYSDARAIPYVEAVVREALRILPGVSMPLERYVPQGGYRLSDGSLLPEGSILGVNPYLLARNKEIYGEDAEDFRPERWLRNEAVGETQEEFERRLAAMNSADLTFGGGRRICTGKNLGLFQVYKVLATLVALYEFDLVEPDREWKVINTLISPSLAAQSTFVSPSESLAFGLSIPDDPNNVDLYFSLAMPRGEYWGAVGLGGHKMRGTLVLMIYSSASADNVTFSPRLATGHTEPEYYSGLDYETLTVNTGYVNDTTYVYSAVCHNCREWPGGSIDVNSTSQEFIFATGPGGNMESDSQRASVKLHYEHGTFTMDMTHATGPAGPAVLNYTTTDDSDGATLVGKITEGMYDWVAVAHAVFMVGCFFGLMPFGVLVLRVGQWVRWHGLNQGVAMLGVIVGFGLGIKTSTLYNRSKSFNTPHQIIGILVFIFLFGQFVLGFMHHRKFKKTQKPTKLAPIHVWLGRLIIVLGIVNGFLGFPLALSPRYDYALLAIIVAVVSMMTLVLSCKLLIARRRRRHQEQERSEGPPPGYNAEPWVVHGQQPFQATSFEMGSLGKNGRVNVSEAQPPPAYT